MWMCVIFLTVKKGEEGHSVKQLHKAIIRSWKGDSANCLYWMEQTYLLSVWVIKQNFWDQAHSFWMLTYSYQLISKIRIISTLNRHILRKRKGDRIFESEKNSDDRYFIPVIPTRIVTIGSICNRKWTDC